MSDESQDYACKRNLGTAQPERGLDLTEQRHESRDTDQLDQYAQHTDHTDHTDHCNYSTNLFSI